jgi:hypothetical protein
MQDTVPTSIITKAQVNNFSVEEKSRREEAIKNKDFYYAKQESYLNLINVDVDPITVGITSVIIKKKNSLLYSRPLVREIDGDSTAKSTLENLYQELKIDHFLQKADLAAELTGTALIYVGNKDDKLHLRLYDASEFSVISNEDDPDVLEAVSIISIDTHISGNQKNPTVKRTLNSQVWTNEYITTFKDGVRQKSEKNELGYIPFTAIKAEEVYGQFLGHAPATGIRQLNAAINQQLTNLGYMIKMQAATPVVLTGFSQGEGVTIHPGSAISLPAGSTASTLTMNPKIDEALKAIQYLEMKVYETSAVPKVTVVGDDKARSGKELLVKWMPLLQVFKNKSLRYQKYELELANMILKVSGLTPIKDINIKFPEEGVLPYTPDGDQLANNFKFGISTPIDEILKLNPTMSETEAEALVLANLQFNKQINPGGLDVRSESNATKQ